MASSTLYSHDSTVPRALKVLSEANKELFCKGTISQKTVYFQLGFDRLTLLTLKIIQTEYITVLNNINVSKNKLKYT